jgi:hypothetical protein
VHSCSPNATNAHRSIRLQCTPAILMPLMHTPQYQTIVHSCSPNATNAHRSIRLQCTPAVLMPLMHTPVSDCILHLSWRVFQCQEISTYFHFIQNYLVRHLFAYIHRYFIHCQIQILVLETWLIAEPLLRRLVAGRSPRNPRLVPRAVHVRFVTVNVTGFCDSQCNRILSDCLSFLLSVAFHQYYIILYNWHRP